jgi:hypothetical protein
MNTLYCLKELKVNKGSPLLRAYFVSRGQPLGGERRGEHFHQDTKFTPRGKLMLLKTGLRALMTYVNNCTVKKTQAQYIGTG